MSESLAVPNPAVWEGPSETTPGGHDEVVWREVAQTAGLTTAMIVAGRLQAEGIPARAWQEGAGRSIGLVIGLLGTGHVVVPESFFAEALTILDSEMMEDGRAE